MFYFQTSLYTVHFEPKDEHNNDQKLVNLEFQKNTNWLGGLAFFKNSFGQPSQYAYGGYSWTIPATKQLLYTKLTAGLMHGYDGEYKDKIPLNENGIAPAIVPSLGIKYKSVHSELTLFGAAGVMLTLGYDFTIPSHQDQPHKRFSFLQTTLGVYFLAAQAFQKTFPLLPQKTQQDQQHHIGL